jgi:hypothetical protein
MSLKSDVTSGKTGGDWWDCAGGVYKAYTFDLTVKRRERSTLKQAQVSVECNTRQAL